MTKARNFFEPVEHLELAVRVVLFLHLLAEFQIELEIQQLFFLVQNHGSRVEFVVS